MSGFESPEGMEPDREEQATLLDSGQQFGPGGQPGQPGGPAVAPFGYVPGAGPQPGPGSPYPAAPPYPPAGPYAPGPFYPGAPGNPADALPPSFGPGYPVAPPYQAAYPYLPGYGRPAGTNGLSIAALVCGICGFIYGVPAILGIIFGFIGMAQTRRTGQQGRGMAIAGIVCGFAWIALFILLIVLLVVAAHDSNLNNPNGFND